MPRQRLTWRSKKASPPPQVPTIGQTEDPGHPAYYPDPVIDQYETGDTSSWAEDPNPGPYPTPGSIPPAVPGNMTTEDVEHPAFMLKQAGFRRQAHERARICVRIASALLPKFASEDMIERKALDLMDFDTKQLRTMLANLMRQAEDEDDDADDDEDIEEEDEEETASKHASRKRKASKKPSSRRAARRRLAEEDEKDEAVEDDEVVEDEDYSEEEEKQSRKKASRRRVAEDEIDAEDDEEEGKTAALRLAKALMRIAGDEDEDEDEEKEARKKASRKRAARRRLAEEEEVEEEEVEETASKRASLRLARALRRIAEDEVEAEDEEEEGKTASRKSKRLAHSIHRIAAKQKRAAVLADARRRKAALGTLKMAMKSRRGRKMASEFFGMDEGELRACMRAEEADIMATEMESADLDGDGIDQDSPFYGYSDDPSTLAMGDEDFMVEDDLYMDDGMGDMMFDDELDIMAEDEDIMSEDEDVMAEYEDMAGEDEDMAGDEDMDLVAMLRSISAAEEDEDEEGVSKEAMQPRAKTPKNGDGGNVNPSPVAKTPQIAGPMVSKAAADPMGLMDASSPAPQVSEADLDMLFGNGGMSHLAEDEMEAEEEEKEARKKSAGRRRTASRGPKTLGTVALSPKTEADEITKLSMLWDSAPDITPLLRRR